MDFSWMQIILTGLIFVWSGFVRSGLGFGGALFTLPFLLLIHDDPLFFLPIISLHLLFFAGLTVVQAERKKGTSENSPTVNWAFVRYALLIMLMPKLAGVIGLLMAHSIDECHYLSPYRWLLDQLYCRQTHAKQQSQDRCVAAYCRRLY